MPLVSDPDQFHLSDEGRGGNPNGNLFFDVGNKHIQFITLSELASFDFGPDDGSDKPIGVAANPAVLTDGGLFNAFFSKYVELRDNDSPIRPLPPIIKAIDRKSGQYELLDGWTFATEDDLKFLRSGGPSTGNPTIVCPSATIAQWELAQRCPLIRATTPWIPR
jgi:hypothetical protein